MLSVESGKIHMSIVFIKLYKNCPWTFMYLKYAPMVLIILRKLHPFNSF